MLNFYTFFLPFQKLHIGKDVEQIPFLLKRDKAYNSKIIVSKLLFPTNDSFFVPIKGRRYSLYLNALLYIFIHRKKIDVLNIYHFGSLSIITGLVYKFYNKKGILLIKADYAPYFQTPLPPKKSSWHKFLLKKFMSKLDILVVEHEYGYNYFKKDLSNNTLLIKAYNGIDNKYFDTPIKYSDKKNIILYVGRVSAKIKNTNFFLEVLQKVNLNNWKIKIIGPIDNDMNDFIKQMYNNRPEFKNKVNITGPIYNKETLFKEYIQAKAVCLVSKSEGFPLVMSEALFFGCYFISTNSSPSISEIIYDEKMGKITDVNSVSQFADALQEYINNEKKHEEYFNYIMNKREMFTWKNSINSIDDAIKFKINEKKILRKTSNR